jgi:pilus assembly protein CpaF
MSHFSIDEILEVDGWDEKRSRLNFRSVFKKEDEA